MVLPDDDADKVIALQKNGEDMLSEFVEEQLIKCTKGFFTNNHKPKLQTFETLSKPTIVNDGGKSQP